MARADLERAAKVRKGSTDIPNLKTTSEQVKTWVNHVGIIPDSLALGLYADEKQSTGGKDL